MVHQDTLACTVVRGMKMIKISLNLSDLKQLHQLHGKVN
jgi:hypothetical protein